MRHDSDRPTFSGRPAAGQVLRWLAWPLWDRRDRRLRAAWRLLVAGGAYTLVLALLSPGLGRAGLAAGRILAALVLGVVGLWLAALILDRRPFADYGFHFGCAWWRDFAFGLALGAALMAAVFAVGWAARWYVVQGTWDASGGLPFARALLTPVAIFLAVGFSEEMTLRGFLLRNLAEGLRLGPVGARAAVALAWALSSLVFGWLHADNPNATLVSTANLALAGLFLGLGYVLTGDLAISIGLHITWNLFQGTVFGLPVSGYLFRQARVLVVAQRGPVLWTGGAFGPEAGLLGLLATALGCAATLLWCRRTRGHLTLCAELALPPAQRR